MSINSKLLIKQKKRILTNLSQKPFFKECSEIDHHKKNIEAYIDLIIDFINENLLTEKGFSAPMIPGETINLNKVNLDQLIENLYQSIPSHTCILAFIKHTRSIFLEIMIHSDLSYKKKLVLILNLTFFFDKLDEKIELKLKRSPCRGSDFLRFYEIGAFTESVDKASPYQ